MAEVGHKVGVHLGGGGERGGGVWDDGNLRPEKVEHGPAVYYNATDSGAVWVGGEEAGGTGRDEVVVTSGYLTGGGKGGGDRGGGGLGWDIGINEVD